MTLLGSIFIIKQPAYAVIAGDCSSNEKVDGYQFNSIMWPDMSQPCEYIPVLTPTETFEIVTGSTTPTASLSIDGKTSVEDRINSSYGVTNYASHTVSVSVTGAESYNLILSGPAQLSGPSTINATTGATGTNLANDTWGYAWEDTSVTDANANYKALGNNIALTGNALSNQATNFSRKLAFAAKFSENSSAGVYHADVSLSLVATPQITTVTGTGVPWDKLVFMQDMTEYACMQAKIGDSKTLTDIRDDSTYTIAKLSDGKCWMTQNLRLSKETLKTYKATTGVTYSLLLSSRDTNNSTDSYYPLPASTTGGFSSAQDSNGFYTNQQIRAASDNDYGAYYSYNAATLNKVVAQDSGTASYDICPKGWRLPTGNTSGEFYKLAQTYPAGNLSGSSNTTGWTTSDVNGKAGRWLGAANATGGAFFPAAGNVNAYGLYNTGSGGNYWSSIINDATCAYTLVFNNSGINPATVYNRYFGYPIRCVAK